MVFKYAQVAALGVVLASPLALAHEEATGIVKERMDLMDRQKDDMKIIGFMAKGKTPFDGPKAAAAAKDIEDTSAKIPDLFPEGTDGHPSEAKPEIWAEWDEFTGNAKSLGEAAAVLAATLDAGADDWKAKFQEVSNACKTCHESFREEEDE
jgi:cytochrome c556